MVMLTNPVNIDDNYDSELDAGYDYGFISKSMGPLVSTRTAEGKDMPGVFLCPNPNITIL